MTSLTLYRAPDRSRRTPRPVLALLFFAFTYVLFTYRALLRYGDAYELLSVDRMGGTLVGAGLYWLVLSQLIDREGAKREPLGVLLTILPASIVVLLARLALDQFIANPSGLAIDLRFVMVWAGYFGLWVSASLALRLPTIQPGSIVKRALPGRPRIASAIMTKGTTPPQSWDTVFDWLATEMKAIPVSERDRLLSQLDRRLDYELADPLEN